MVLVGDILLEQPKGVALAEHDDALEELSPAAAGSSTPRSR